MATSRTGTASHKRFRREVLRRDEAQGITTCPLCGVTLDYQRGRQPHSAEPDHIIPVAHGGTDHPDNGRTICRQCNQSRGDGTRRRHVATVPKTITNLLTW